MKIIFLDVDGVLNRYKATPGKWSKKEGMPLDHWALDRLRLIVARTGAKLVVSSTWRHHQNAMQILEQRLSEYGMKIFDTTRTDNNLPRCEQIRQWLRDNHTDSWVVLDDDNVANLGDGSLCLVDGDVGLSGMPFLVTQEVIARLNSMAAPC